MNVSVIGKKIIFARIESSRLGVSSLGISSTIHIPSPVYFFLDLFDYVFRSWPIFEENVFTVALLFLFKRIGRKVFFELFTLKFQICFSNFFGFVDCLFFWRPFIFFCLFFEISLFLVLFLVLFYVYICHYLMFRFFMFISVGFLCLFRLNFVLFIVIVVSFAPWLLIKEKRWCLFEVGWIWKKRNFLAKNANFLQLRQFLAIKKLLC